MSKLCLRPDLALAVLSVWADFSVFLIRLPGSFMQSFYMEMSEPLPLLENVIQPER